MPSISRRDFAKGLGAAALAAPFFSLLKKAPAQSAGRQAKYLFIFFTNGTDAAAWTPAGSSETRIQFSPMTEPLAPLKANLVLVEHMSSSGTADNHAAPGGLTGKGYGGQNHLSIDQFVADGLRLGGIETPIASLILGGVDTQEQSTFWRNGQRLSPIFSPQAAFQTIFSGAGGGTGGGGIPPEVIRRRQSAVDLVRGELNQLSDALGSEERVKLELHVDSIRQLEERLTGGGGGGGGGTVVDCSSPAAPGSGGQPLLDSVLHLDLAVAAFACDITRVAAVEFGNHQSTQVSIPEVGDPGDWHNSFIHGDNPRTRLVNLERWLCQQFVATADKLKATPAPDGNGTLFDQTLMMWARDMGDAVVHNGDLRFVFAGGAGGYLKVSPEGRYIDAGGQPHQRALVTCADALGLTDVSAFGDPNISRTPFDGLIA
ncbi:MAG TPA: DUF1552 domain-containing protein [Candidatus Acidoferrum sp.]|nr:DUF1552 domain-containing protein [Candidatus Acidoferrum sp.]